MTPLPPPRSGAALSHALSACGDGMSDARRLADELGTSCNVLRDDGVSTIGAGETVRRRLLTERS